jgi:hypothetical protein
VSKQRERPASVIWKANRKLCPVDRTASELIFTVSCFFDESSVRPHKTFDFSL